MWPNTFAARLAAWAHLRHTCEDLPVDQALDQIWLTYEHHIEQISDLRTSSSASVGMIATLIGTDSVDGQFIPVAFT